MKCDNCTEKCPQEELACEIAKGRMYATKEVIRLQKELKEVRAKAIDEFAERLHDLCGFEIDGIQYPYLLCESRIDEIAEEYKAVAKNATTTWIPVNEGLPDLEKEVLILVKRKFQYSGKESYIMTSAIYEDGNINENASILSWDDIDGEWDEGAGGYIIPKGWWECQHFPCETYKLIDEGYNKFFIDKVIAWQPLPAPYQPKGE